MVSDQYRVNVAMANDPGSDSEKVREKKGSISSPVPQENVASVLEEYFGIPATEKLYGYNMQAHDRLVGESGEILLNFYSFLSCPILC